MCHKMLTASLNVYYCLTPYHTCLLTAVTGLHCRRGCVRWYIRQNIKERCVTMGWATDFCRCVLSVFLSYLFPILSILYFIFYYAFLFLHKLINSCVLGHHEPVVCVLFFYTLCDEIFCVLLRHNRNITKYPSDQWASSFLCCSAFALSWWLYPSFPMAHIFLFSKLPIKSPEVSCVRKILKWRLILKIYWALNNGWFDKKAKGVMVVVVAEVVIIMVIAAAATSF